MKLGTRILKGLASIKRFPEVIKCLSTCRSAGKIALAYLGFIKLDYPYEVSLKNGLRILVKDWQDLTTIWVVLFGGEYRLKSEDKVIVDVGANIGAFVVLAASKVVSGQIIAIEPFPENYNRLLGCIDVNRLQGRVTPKSYAIAGVSGPVVMDADPEIASHSRSISQNGVSQHFVEVQAWSLEDFMVKEGLSHIDFLKLDVEGAEYDIITNTPPHVLEKIDRIGLEYHEYGVEKIKKHLVEQEFEITYFPKRGSSGVVEFTRCAHGK